MNLWLLFYHKRVSRIIWKTIYLFRQKYWKIHKHYSSNRKEVTRIDKNKEKITKIYLTYYSLLIAQDLWQVHYQILSIILWIKCKFRHDDGKCETCRIKYKYCDCFLEYINFKDDSIEYKWLYCNKKKVLWKIKGTFFWYIHIF